MNNVHESADLAGGHSLVVAGSFCDKAGIKPVGIVVDAEVADGLKAGRSKSCTEVA